MWYVVCVCVLDVYFGCIILFNVFINKARTAHTKHPRSVCSNVCHIYCRMAAVIKSCIQYLAISHKHRAHTWIRRTGRIRVCVAMAAQRLYNNYCYYLGAEGLCKVSGPGARVNKHIHSHRVWDLSEYIVERVHTRAQPFMYDTSPRAREPHNEIRVHIYKYIMCAPPRSRGFAKRPVSRCLFELNCICA